MHAQSTNILIIRNLTVAYHEEPVLWSVSVNILSGVLLGVIGPNGAGKTTFIKTIAGLMKPLAGVIEVLVDKSCKVPFAYVPQRTLIDWDFPLRVFDVVMMGRYPMIGWIKRPRKLDHDLVWQALDQVGMKEFAYRAIGQLSGGQQQRVFLARALVQNAPIYLLDEPFNGVDMGTEKMIIGILKRLRDRGKTIIVVHHNLQTVTEYFDWLLHLDVHVKAYGKTNEIISDVPYNQTKQHVKQNF